MVTLFALIGCMPEPFRPDVDATKLRFDPDTSLPPALDEFDVDHTAVVDDAEVAALGKLLFTDATLSSDGTVSCVTCHDICLDPDCEGPFDGEPGTPGQGVELGVADRDVALSSGIGGLLARNTPTLRETARRVVWGWAGQYSQLDEQCLAPIEKELIYGHPAGLEDAIAPARSAVAAAVTAGYTPDTWPSALGPLSYPDDEESQTYAQDLLAYEEDILADVGLALEAYLRSLARDWPTTTALDRAIAGDEGALDASELRGLELFVGKAHCVDCHTGPLLTDEQLHGTSVPGADPGGGDGGFLTPPLRNLVLTPPYMHDGSLATLDEVVWHYDTGGALPPDVVGTPDPRFQPLLLDPGEVADLRAFLATLGPS